MSDPSMQVQTPQLPTSAWVMGWSFVAAQAVAAVSRGLQPSDLWPFSILVSVALTCFFAHGVLRARMVRFWIVVAFVVIAAVVELVGMLDGEPDAAAYFLLSCLTGGSILAFTKSAWWAWMQTRPADHPSLAPIMWLAVLSGVLGGLIGAESSGFHVQLSL